MSERMAQRPLSSRSRFVLVAALATLPLVAVVSYAAVDGTTPTGGARAHAPRRAEPKLVALAPPTDGGVLAIITGSGRIGASSGGPGALPQGLVPRTGTFRADGRGGVERVWSLSPAQGSTTRIAYGVKGSVVYGASQAALRRDLALAALAALAAIVAAFALS